MVFLRPRSICSCCGNGPTRSSVVQPQLQVLEVSAVFFRGAPRPRDGWDGGWSFGWVIFGATGREASQGNLPEGT